MKEPEYDWLLDPEWEEFIIDKKDWKTHIHPLIRMRWKELTPTERLICYGFADMEARK